MCRMLAAMGRFSMASVVEAVRVIATNENPAYEHELRERGDAFQHDSGWGAVYREEGRLVRVRSTDAGGGGRLSVAGGGRGGKGPRLGQAAE